MQKERTAMTQSETRSFSSPIGVAEGTGHTTGRLWLIASLLTALAVVLAVGWLAPVVLAGGNQLAKAQETRSHRSGSISEFLTRQADGNILGLRDGTVSVLYATPKYFQIAGKTAQAAEYMPDQYVIFIISEEIHLDDLPLSPPQAKLRISGNAEYLSPEGVQVLIDSYHHRSSVVRFPLVNGQGGSLLSNASSVELILNPAERPAQTVSTHWDLPIAYPDSLERGANIGFGTLLALVAGLLAALSPCLTQLTACYLSTLAGVGVRQQGDNSQAVRARVMRVAILFVVGFTLVYTAAGAIAGLAGQTIQSSGLLVKWSGTLGMLAGVLLIAMGLWVGFNARAPLVCRLPMPTFMRLSQSGGVFGPVILGFAFALGCATCFSGALFAALLLYLGTTATALQGATILFVFSLGIAIPYLLAAATLSRSLPLLDQVEKIAPMIGLVSSIVIIGFGFLMLTGNFHAVSDEVYLWLRWMSLLK